MRLFLRNVATVFFCVSGASIALAESPSGIWERPSTGTRIKFYECGGGLCAKIVSVKDQARKATVGTVIMNGAKKVSQNKWAGKILNTENGKIYSGQATFTGGGSVKLQGCLAGGVICSGETWQRAN